MTFDPYHKWLGIHPSEHPITYYRLLGVREFESDPDVIEHAADRQMAHLRNFALGQYVRESQSLLNEITQARLVLLTSDRRAAYDANLMAWRSGQTAAAAPVAAPLAASEPASPDSNPAAPPTTIRVGLSRRRSGGRLRTTIGLAQILLGGAAGLCVAIVALWTIWRRDPLGIIGKDLAANATPSATAGSTSPALPPPATSGSKPRPAPPANEPSEKTTGASAGRDAQQAPSGPPQPAPPQPSSPRTTPAVPDRDPRKEKNVGVAEPKVRPREDANLEGTKQAENTQATPNVIASPGSTKTKPRGSGTRPVEVDKPASAETNPSKATKAPTKSEESKETDETSDSPESTPVKLTREDWIEKRDIALANGDLPSVLRAVESLAEMAKEPVLASKLSFLAGLTVEQFPDQKNALSTLLDLMETAVEDGESNAVRPYLDATIARARKLGDRALERRATILTIKAN